MKILRVLNTNAVLTADTDGREMVLLGAGLGFKHRPGDIIDPGRVEKAFHLTNKAYQKRFQELIDSIPDTFIIIAEQIIAYGKSTYSFQLSETIHISLADHIKQAVDNFHNGFIIPNPIMHEIRHCYKNEYQTAQYGLGLIHKEFGVEFPDDEAGFIAMHFVSAEYANANENTNAKKIITIVSDINDIIQKELQITLDEHSPAYYRYMTHLNYLAERIVSNNFTDDDTMHELLAPLISTYAKEYLCAKKVARYIQKSYNHAIKNDEILYLVIHLVRLVTT